MMSKDRELLDEYLQHLSDRYYAYELVERLEALEIITIWDILNAFEDQIIEAKPLLEEENG
jgi:Fe2+ or Zn2+ uptake regulation protein